MKNVRNYPKFAGYEELQNINFRIKDSKTQEVILCFRCGKSALGHREIISCDYCSLKWHLDCLDPPLSNPPVRDPLHRQKHSWMCPAHTTQDLTNIGRTGRMHKLRRPKNAKIVDAGLRRGFHNNGVIEIENDPSDEDEIVDMKESVIYRLTEKSIKLDFIDRVRKSVLAFPLSLA